MANQSGPSSDTLTIEIETMAWERIQLVLRARVPAGLARIDPGRLGLQADDAAGTFLPATHAEIDGNRLYLRFNVMQGPGLMPLDSRRWTLVVDSGGQPLCVRGEAATMARFQLPDYAYVATPWIDPERSSFSIVVAFEPVPRRTVLSPRWRSPRRLLRAVRQRTFELLVDFVADVSSHRGKRILFTSDSAEALSGNLKVVHDRMVERGLHKRYEVRTLLKSSVTHPRSLADRLRMPILFGRADVILLDDYQPAIYRLRPRRNQRIVQLWHASGAFKTVGYSRVGKPGGPDPYSRVHKNYTNATVSSQHDVPFYAEAFGIPENRVVPTGIPRMDRFFDSGQGRQATVQAAQLFPQIAGRQVFLFAPTFRGGGPRTAYYDFDRLDLGALHKLAVERDAVVLIKMHPFVRQPPPIPASLRDRLIDASRSAIDINDLLFAVDLLITDYSSIVFEFSTLGRPMLFFAYDLDEYIASRDFYVPFREFVPGRIVTTFDELLEAIRNEDFRVEKVAEFARRHFDHLDGTSTDRVIDELILP
jgi:CDP-ribitol ribitolphosphotransferase